MIEWIIPIAGAATSACAALLAPLWAIRLTSKRELAQQQYQLLGQAITALRAVKQHPAKSDCDRPECKHDLQGCTEREWWNQLAALLDTLEDYEQQITDRALRERIMFAREMAGHGFALAKTLFSDERTFRIHIVAEAMDAGYARQRREDLPEISVSTEFVRERYRAFDETFRSNFLQ